MVLVKTEFILELESLGPTIDYDESANTPSLWLRNNSLERRLNQLPDLPDTGAPILFKPASLGMARRPFTGP